MGSNTKPPGSENPEIRDVGVERTPRQPAIPPSVSNPSAGAGGAWSGGGEDGGDSRVSVGTSVGVGVGTSVGVGVGTSVGVGVGTSVGIGVGTSVGIGVGTSVGIGVGTSVGIGVGTSVGIGTGTSVGIGVGTSVGIGTGTGTGVSADFTGGGQSESGAPLDTSGAEAGLRHLLLVARQQELLATQGAKAAARDGERMTPRDLWRTVHVAQPALSPCGEWVAFSKQERPSGGALELERIFLKRVGSGVGRDEYPLTDTSVLADTPVWKPDLFDRKTGQSVSTTVEGRTEILFRARATSVDVLQLYVVEVDLPQSKGDDLRIGRVRRLTNHLTHPWAPKWRRWHAGEDGFEHNRVYFVASSPEATPVGYDHLVFDTALVGWWNNLRLPHDRWRFFEVDAYAPETPRDLLGSHQPLLDFVNGVWNCWDVHPAGEGLVWSAVNRQFDAKPGDEFPGWPNDITLDIYRSRLRRDGEEVAAGSSNAVTCLTSGIVSQKQDPQGSAASGPEGTEVPRTGRFDDYMPMYSPDGTYIVYAEKQFSTLPADYPRLVRMNLPEEDGGPVVEGEDVFDIIRETPVADDQHSDGLSEDLTLPLSWKFSGSDELLVVVEEAGQHHLRSVSVPSAKIAPQDVNAPRDVGSPGADDTDGNRRGAVLDFDVKPSSDNQSTAAFCAVASGLTQPPEILFSTSGASASNFNALISKKYEALRVSEMHFDRRQPMRRRLFGPSRESVQAYLVYPKEFESAIKGGSYVGGRKYPLVHMLHGGPNSAWIDEFHTRFNAGLVASQGYIVALVNFRGSTGTPEREPDVHRTRSSPARSVFLTQLKLVNSEDVNRVVEAALNHLDGAGRSTEEGANIQEDLDRGRFTLRHLRKIERHAHRERAQRFVAALQPDQYEKLIQRRDDRDAFGWGSAMSDIDLVTTELRAKGYIDPKRLAVIGGSYGAFLGARLLGWRHRVNPYRAYVLHAGVYDPLSQYATDAFWVQYQNFGERPWMRHRADEAYSGDFDDGDPTNWRNFSRISPLLRSQRLVEDVKANEGPAVLITHGLDDLRVHWQQSVLLHRMLKDRGVTSRLALYPGLGHRLDLPEPSVQWWTAALGWLNDNGVGPG